jgi:tetratricopeptide (TPR) repeat protein
MQFETTRALPTPDRAALALALTHAREACRLDPASGEAWATLGLALDRHGQHLDALAATRQAVTLERDNWRHTFRLSSLAWGEERLRAAHRTLTLLPGFPLAHWMVATVHVARQSLDLAAEALDAGLASAGAPPDAPAPSAFHPVALHWLRGLIHLAQDDDARAVTSLDAETAGADSGHLYARESAANAWYALGALRHRQGRADDAAHAFDRALALVPQHPMALACRHRDARGPLAEAALLAFDGRSAEAASAIDATLAGAAPGSVLWFLPVDPLLAPWQAPGVWADALRRLRARAA